MLAGIAALAPIHAVIVTVGILIFADLATGIWAAKKRNESITSGRLRDSVTKMFVYQTAIVTGFLIETYLIGGLVPIVKLAGAVIGFVEAKSLFENLNEISGQDLFKTLIEKLGSKNK